MSPVSLLPAILALLLAILTSQAIVKLFKIAPTPGRYAAIDGLRGYLAFCVFLHHSCVWYFYARSGIWQVPPSNAYTNFGQTSVTLFFMITGFLFFSKLIEGRSRPIDWPRLFISRVLRLVPLYAFAMFLLFTIVAVLSHGALHESLRPIIKNLIRWCSFTILGGPDLNAIPNTNLIIARVTWSLPYEWSFYLSLPLLALLIGVNPKPKVLLFSAIVLAVIFCTWRPGWNAAIYNITAFIGGIAASFAVRSPKLLTLSRQKTTELAALAGLLSVIFLFPTTHSVLAILILSLVFITIACGNDFFGFLAQPFSRVLGEMAYSIYLLHGIFLFVLFHFLIGPETLKTLPVLTHWSIVLATVPFLVAACFTSFSLIEHPAMQSAPSVTRWIRNKMR